MDRIRKCENRNIRNIPTGGNFWADKRCPAKQHSRGINNLASRGEGRGCLYGLRNQMRQPGAQGRFIQNRRFQGPESLSECEIDGYIQSHRDLDIQSQAAKQANNRTGGYFDDSPRTPEGGELPPPPGLSVDCGYRGNPPMVYQVQSGGNFLKTSTVERPGDANQRAHMYHRGAGRSDFAHTVEQMRNIIFRSDGWIIP